MENKKINNQKEKWEFVLKGYEDMIKRAKAYRKKSGDQYIITDRVWFTREFFETGKFFRGDPNMTVSEFAVKCNFERAHKIMGENFTWSYDVQNWRFNGFEVAIKNLKLFKKQMPLLWK